MTAGSKTTVGGHVQGATVVTGEAAQVNTEAISRVKDRMDTSNHQVRVGRNAAMDIKQYAAKAVDVVQVLCARACALCTCGRLMTYTGSEEECTAILGNHNWLRDHRNQLRLPSIVPSTTPKLLSHRSTLL